MEACSRPARNGMLAAVCKIGEGKMVEKQGEGWEVYVSCR